MVRHQVVHTQYLADEDIRLISVECPNCGNEEDVICGFNSAVGATICANCGQHFEYEEDYEEVSDC